MASALATGASFLPLMLMTMLALALAVLASYVELLGYYAFGGERSGNSLVVREPAGVAGMGSVEFAAVVVLSDDWTGAACSAIARSSRD